MAQNQRKVNFELWLQSNAEFLCKAVSVVLVCAVIVFSCLESKALSTKMAALGALHQVQGRQFQ